MSFQASSCYPSDNSVTRTSHGRSTLRLDLATQEPNCQLSDEARRCPHAKIDSGSESQRNDLLRLICLPAFTEHERVPGTLLGTRETQLLPKGLHFLLQNPAEGMLPSPRESGVKPRESQSMHPILSPQLGVREWVWPLSGRHKSTAEAGGSTNTSAPSDPRGSQLKDEAVYRQDRIKRVGEKDQLITAPTVLSHGNNPNS